MNSLTTSSAVLLLLSAAGQANAARVVCNAYGQCRRQRSGLGSGIIAAIAIVAAIFVLLLLCCTVLRRKRAMKFRAKAVGQQPGRQVGFMYFPTPGERTGTNQNGPHMAEMGQNHTGASSFGNTHNSNMNNNYNTTNTNDYNTGAPNMPMPQHGASTNDLPSPPPVYNPAGQYKAPAGAPPSGPGAGNAYAPPSGPPPPHT